MEAAAEPPVLPRPPVEAIEFTGRWDEYFKIWIVNILLTILTLGLYAAWAKVRKRRYLYSNTRLFGHAFEYLAEPRRILVGNLIVVLAFTTNTFLGAISPLLQLPFLLFLIVATPWIICRALAFNARNTAWRGIRFDFSGKYLGALLAYVLYPGIVFPTLGLGYPVVVKFQKEWVVNHHSYGTSRFGLTGPFGHYFRSIILGELFFLPLVGAYFSLIFVMVRQGFAAARQGNTQPPAPPDLDTLIVPGLIFLVALPLAFVGAQYIRARVFNLVWGGTTIAGNRFRARMRARDLIRLQLFNTLAIILTAGFATPWATVRKVRYQLSCLSVDPAGNIDGFVAMSQQPVGALGEVASGFFDLDIGFGA